MDTAAKRRMPPLWIFMFFFISLYTAISISLTMLFKLPWWTSIPVLPGLLLGIPLVILGIGAIAWSIRTLSVRRAMGKELFLDKSECKLITDGPYSYTRNPLYLSAFINILGWFLILRLTPLGILTAIFVFHFYAVAKWEESELKKRFGPAYIEYARRVPLFFPRFNKAGDRKYKTE